MVKKLFVLAILACTNIYGQVVGKTVTEDYQAEFERQASVYEIPEYFGEPVPVAILVTVPEVDVLPVAPVATAVTLP